jgi:hypothetical protein
VLEISAVQKRNAKYAPQLVATLWLDIIPRSGIANKDHNNAQCFLVRRCEVSTVLGLTAHQSKMQDLDERQEQDLQGTN